jgi:hypothetical protein
MTTAQLATVPERMEALIQVIDSLAPQVDRLNVMLNGHTGEQAVKLYNRYANSKHINFHRRDNSMTDAEKYYRVEELQGYILTCDDDILYPPDYVKYMISKVEQYDRKFVVTLHGRVYSGLPIYSFYRDRKPGFNTPGAGMFRCMDEVKGDHIILADGIVGCGGDGVMCWHSDTLQMRYEYCELPNMSQLWMALTCNHFNVPQIVVEHPSDFLTYLLDDDSIPTIWGQHNESDGVQTNLINTRWIFT